MVDLFDINTSQRESVNLLIMASSYWNEHFKLFIIIGWGRWLYIVVYLSTNIDESNLRIAVVVVYLHNTT